MSSRKRKHARRGSPDYNTGGEPSSFNPSCSASLLIQAHEATIVHNRPDLVQLLTAHNRGDGQGGLIQWDGDGSNFNKGLWMDRYDARLLLSSVHTANARVDTRSAPPSPTGWSDIPSDSEDTFFFNPEEIEEFRREKRRRLMEAGRQERLRAIRESDPDPGRDFAEDRESWGDDDEQPEDGQRTLMERTAKHLLTSPNAGQLEMRILANHGSDPRFAFLRGRWRNAWHAIKLAAKVEIERLEPKKTAVVQSIDTGLVAYGDSDASDAEEPGSTVQDHNAKVDADAITHKEAEHKKEARRARAIEWMRQRKAAKASDA